MRQLLHLLVVDPDRRSALAGWRGSRWLLPMIACPERARATLLVARWAAERCLHGDVIGQWLGTVAADGSAIDWLLAFRVTVRSPRPPADLCWAPLEELTSAPSLLEYQLRATREATAGGSLAVPGPFGTGSWPDDVRAWTCNIVGASHVQWVTTYRASPFHVVLKLATPVGDFYFKGLTAAVSAEPLITTTLSRLAPARFARTRALESRSDLSTWWLTDACPGLALEPRHGGDGPTRVAAACADVQRWVGTADAVEIPRIDLSGAEAWANGLLDRAGTGGACRSQIARAFQDVIRAGVPHTWTPLDLDPGNVLLDDRGDVRFIDLDDSYIGPAPLAPATFARRASRLDPGGRNGLGRKAIYRAYQQAWQAGMLTEEEWTSFEVVSIVLEASLGWSRVASGVARGEIRAAFGPIRSRVARSLCRDLAPYLARGDDHRKG
jgi:hypothetical protein